MSNPTREEVERWLAAFREMHDAIKEIEPDNPGMLNSILIGELALRALDMRDALSEAIGNLGASPPLYRTTLARIIMEFDGGGDEN